MKWTNITPTVWTEVKPQSSQAARGGFAITSYDKATHLVVPPNVSPTATHADIFSDGNGRIAVRFSKVGARKMSPSSNRSKTRRLYLPVGKFPKGTTPVELTRDDDLWVLDLKSIGAAA